jgi:hypothetical protein
MTFVMTKFKEMKNIAEVSIGYGRNIYIYN